MVAVCGFEIDGSVFLAGRNVPRTAAFVGDQREGVVFCDLLHEVGVGEDGGEAVVDGESACAQSVEVCVD